MIENKHSKTIETERLYLRQFNDDDLDSYAGIMGDDEVGKWLPKERGLTREETKGLMDYILKNWDEYGYGIWAVTEKNSGILLGHCGLRMLPETSEVEVLYALAKNYWGNGYATEAVKTCVAYGFESLKLERIIGLTKPDNIASRRVIEKAGLQYVRDAEYFSFTCAYHGISKSEFLQIT